SSRVRFCVQAEDGRRDATVTGVQTCALPIYDALAVMVRDGERVVDHRMCLVPRGEYEVVDDWHVLGMRSTGSKSVKASELFVPRSEERRVGKGSSAPERRELPASTPRAGEWS